MSTTSNMNLNLPTPTVTEGPEWADKVNTAFEVIDAHDHSSGKGVKITPKGLNINSDLTMNGNSLTDTKSLRLVSNSAVLSAVNDAISIYAANGNLYYNNNNNVPVQITNGTTVTSSSDGISRTYEVLTTSANIVLNPSTSASYIAVNTTSGQVAITLPNAGAVAKGRFFIIKDSPGSAGINAVTITPNGTQTIDNLNSALTISTTHGSYMLISDGVSNWEVLKQPVTTNNLQDGSVTNAKIALNTITTDKFVANVNNITITGVTFNATSPSGSTVTSLTAVS